jgi:hypothetical protein
VDPTQAFCGNPDCPARGQLGQGNIKAHSHVADWYAKSGAHGQDVHAHFLHSHPLDLQPVQADELYAKCVRGLCWMAMAGWPAFHG